VPCSQHFAQNPDRQGGDVNLKTVSADSFPANPDTLESSVPRQRRKRITRLRYLTATLGCCICMGACSSLDLFAASNESDTEIRLALIDKYVDATHVQQESLRGLQMEVNIDAQLPKLEKHGKLRALRKISRLGQITYKALGFSGDNTVKQEVITRYLAAESAARENGTIAITPANYKFRYAGRIVQHGVALQILEVTPKKKAVGLFKGELWIDADTGMPIREAGQFVKTPSVFLKKIAFVRDYELRDGVAFPVHIQSTVDTRIVGRAELEISFSNFSRPEGADDDATADVSSESSGAVPLSQSEPPVPVTIGAPEAIGAPEGINAPELTRAPGTTRAPATPNASGTPVGPEL
jgi:hypothetical protein